MADQRPRVIGLPDLLTLRRRLPDKPAPLVFFTDKEFARLTKGAVELPRRPRGGPLAAFDPWPSGGMVQGKCESPPGQTCFGRWTPAGPGRGAGVYFDCVCTVIKGGGGDPLPIPCRLVLRAGGFQCSGSCQASQQCRLALWKEASGRVVLDCRCASVLVLP